MIEHPLTVLEDVNLASLPLMLRLGTQLGGLISTGITPIYSHGKMVNAIWLQQHFSDAGNKTLERTRHPTKEDAIVASMLWVICLPTESLGIAVGWAYWKLRKELNPSFCLLMVSSAIYENIFLSIYVFYMAPITALPNNRDGPGGFWARRIGHISNIAWFGCCYHMLAVTANRSCAIVFPQLYERIFNHTNTKLLLYFLSAISFFTCCWQFLDRYGCGFVYYRELYSFWYIQSECSRFWGELDLRLTQILPLMTCTLTVVSAVFFFKKSWNNMEHEAETKKERRFYIVTFFNAFLYVAASTSWAVAIRWPLSPFQAFFCINLPFCLSVASNGVASFILVPKVRERVMRSGSTRDSPIC